MAPEDRDRHFDQALARHLRAESCAPSAGSQGFTSAGDCLDTETLAAYHERSLLPEEMNSCKEHIVGCAQCQAVLAQLELTDEIPFVTEEELVAVSVPAARAAAAAPAPERPASPEAVARKARRLQLLRGASWQWLTATSALAAGLLVWVALHENQSLPLKNIDSTKVAENRAPVPAPAASAPADSKAMSQNLPSAKTPAVLTAPSSAATGSEAGSGRREDTFASVQSPSPRVATRGRANSLDDRDLALKKNAERDAALNELSPGVASDGLRAPTDVSVTAQGTLQQKEKKEQLDAAKQDLNGLAQNQAQNQANYGQNYSPQKVGGPSPLNQATPPAKPRTSTAGDLAAPAASAAAAKRAASSPSPAPPPPQAEATGGVASNYRDSSSSLEMISAVNPRLIPVAGTNLLWRAGRGGLIDFSKDGGSSWSHQNSGVLTELLTGSAPSDQVCWIVGRVGAIVLTIDRGADWKVIKSPLTEDLGGVQATDALHATIWNARNTKRMQTSDGGATWTFVPVP